MISQIIVSSLICAGCRSDIIFVLDESSSTGQGSFIYAVDFITRIVHSLDIGYHGDQVIINSYQRYLNQYHTGKCKRRFGGIYAYCRYLIDRKWKILLLILYRKTCHMPKGL